MRTSSRQSTAHAPRIALAASLALLLTSPASAQDSQARVGPVKGAVIKGGQNAPPAFCIASESPATDYRLKVWQLMQGQSGVDAVASNQVIATTTYHAINTKGAGSNDRTSAPTSAELTAACTAALQAPAPVSPAAAVVKTRTKSNNSNDRTASPAATAPATIAVITLDRFPACARGRTCGYAWTVEPVAPAGKKSVTLHTSVQVPYEFAIAPDGTITSASSGRE